MTKPFSIARPPELLACCRGSNAVEFCLVLPVFLLLMFAMTGFGLYLGAAHGVAQLAAEGARASLAGLDGAERESISRDRISRAAPSYPLLQGGDLSVDTKEEGASFSVVVRYDASHLPIWNIGFGRFAPSPLIERAAVVEFGGF